MCCEGTGSGIDMGIGMVLGMVIGICIVIGVDIGIDIYNGTGGVIAIGDNWVRYLIAQNILKMIPSFNFVNAIHPSAQIAGHVTLKRGTVVMPGAVINSYTEIGEFCIINTNSSIDHDNVFESYSSIMPNASTGGGVRVGKFSALGMGASVLQKVHIGTHTIIGAGSVVLENADDYSVVIGSPAKVKKTRNKGDAYL